MFLSHIPHFVSLSGTISLHNASPIIARTYGICFEPCHDFSKSILFSIKYKSCLLAWKHVHHFLGWTYINVWLVGITYCIPLWLQQFLNGLRSNSMLPIVNKHEYCLIHINLQIFSRHQTNDLMLDHSRAIWCFEWWCYSAIHGLKYTSGVGW